MTLASLQQQNYSIRAMARVLQRSPSTISRELIRNADANSYASSQAQKGYSSSWRQVCPTRRFHAPCIFTPPSASWCLAYCDSSNLSSPPESRIWLAKIFPRSASGEPWDFAHWPKQIPFWSGWWTSWKNEWYGLWGAGQENFIAL